VLVRARTIREERVMKDLGYANGWTETPEEVKKCRDGHNKGEEHAGYSKTIGRCLTEYRCSTCGYSYKVDSSD
jgi:hypothetical protein